MLLEFFVINKEWRITPLKVRLEAERRMISVHLFGPKDVKRMVGQEKNDTNMMIAFNEGQINAS